MSATKRGRGRPRREYRIRVRAERREIPDYDKLARALLEHAAMQAQREATVRPDTTDDSNKSDASEEPS
ncbi:hypothetical protein MMX123_02723 [Microbacterium sp. MM2322]|uniref:hypothetical protein n=1 Tax=unclassified Microbacterium TaxID=2609290 RepID=UPI00177AE21F|nr:MULTISPECIES: hypothetical protein [unclassified Microbacterium]MBD8207795.1 hypothetical protein [Microbacterium sp. CFBP 8801]MBD8510363.1 hypothetical protein [Microbacterium sp. CFBP 8790]